MATQSYEYSFFYNFAINKLCFSADLAAFFADALTRDFTDCTCEQALFVEDGQTIDFSGDGTEATPLTGEVIISDQPGNDILVLDDGLYVNTSASDCRLLFGGVVSWTGTGYTYHVSAATYILNGTIYNSPATEVTLDPSDPDLDRIDMIIVDSSETVSVLTGTPAEDPTRPIPIECEQIALATVLVGAGTTEPDILMECIYEDNSEWSSVSSSVRIDPTSLAAPCEGTSAIEASDAQTADYVILTRVAPIDISSVYNVFTFKLKPKADWNADPADSYLTLNLQLGGTTFGQDVIIANGTYGFDSTNPTCQTVSLLLSDFGVSASQDINRLKITVTATSDTFGWYMDNICLQSIDIVDDQGFKIYTEDTVTLDLSGDGTLSNPLKGDVRVSAAEGNLINILADGLFAGDINNRLVYGGVVTWLQDYDFHVTAAGYYINNVFYESPATDVTLSPSDPLLDRFDVIYVDTSATVQVLEGVPADAPLQPGLDLGSQLGLSVVFVEAGSTSPVDLVEECIYQENGEWTTSVSDGSINPASANTPCIGALGIEATTASNNDFILLTRGTTFSPTATYNVITFRLKPKSDWSIDPTVHSLKLSFRLAGVQVGNEITIGHGNELDVTDLTCQIISVETALFGVGVSDSVDEFLVRVSSTSGDFGWFMDGLCLQGGIFGAEQGDFIWNQFFGAQTPGRFWIRGIGRADKWFTSPNRIGTTETFYGGSEKYGSESSAAWYEALAIGWRASVTGPDFANVGGIAIGSQSVSDGGLSVGYGSTSGTQSNTAIGKGTNTSTSLGAVALGANARVLSSNNSIAIGESTVNTTAPSSITIGYNAQNTSGEGTIAIGTESNSAGFDYSIVLGAFAEPTANYQLILGGSDIGSNFGIREVYVGGGVTSPAPTDVLFTISGSEGTDTAGTVLRFAAPKATGNAAGGTFEWQTSDAGASGSSLQSLTTKMYLNSNTKGLSLSNIRFEQYKGSDVVAANNLTLGTGNMFTITGNTQINAITATNWQASSWVILQFTGTPTLKHNTAGGAGTAPIQLAGSVDYTASANDTILLAYDGTDWHEVSRKTSGFSIGTLTAANNGTSLSGTTTVQLGQAIGAVGNPAILLSHREIPSANFTINFNADAAQTNEIVIFKNTAGNTRARITANANFSNTGGQTGGEMFGAGASVLGQNSVAVGSAATANSQSVVIGASTTDATSGGSNVVIGLGATATGVNPGTVLIGSSATTSGGSNVVIGSGATATGGQVVVVGYASTGTGNNSTTVGVNAGAAHEYSQVYGFGAVSTATNQLVFGSSNNTYGGVNDVYIGRGVTCTVANDLKVQPTGSSGSNMAGNNFTLAAGAATGNAAGGEIRLQTSDAGASGTSLQSLSERMRITSLYTSMTSTRFEEAKGANITAANDLTLGIDGNLFVITGNTQINAITTANWQSGSKVGFVFTGTPTVKHNTAGGGGTATMLLAGSEDFVAAAGDYIEFRYDGTNWHEVGRKLATTGSGPTMTADNGLSKNTATNVQLGSASSGVANSPLLHNTYINTGSFRLYAYGESATLPPLTANNFSGGPAFHAVSSSGPAVYAQSNTGPVINTTMTASNQNSALEILRLNRETTGGGGVGQTGIGAYIDILLHTSTTAGQLGHRIQSEYTVVTHGSQTSKLTISAANGGSTVEALVLGGEGYMKLRPITATAASAITAADGMIVCVSDTDATFTSIGFWGYSNGAWAKF